jgi:hypothetical protein
MTVRLLNDPVDCVRVPLGGLLSEPAADMARILEAGGQGYLMRTEEGLKI